MKENGFRIRDSVFWMQYPALALMWLWLFREGLYIRLAAGLPLLVLSALSAWRPAMMTRPVTLFGLEYPEGVAERMTFNLSWLGIAVSIMILAGFRITHAGQLGLVGLLFLAVIAANTIFWVRSSGPEERDRYRGIWALNVTVTILFIVMGVFLISRWDHRIRMFEEMSPLPMMIVFLAFGVWHYLMLRRKAREAGASVKVR